MEFTEIHQISSFSFSSFSDKNIGQYVDITSLEKQEPKHDDILNEPFFNQVMKNLEQITSAQMVQPLWPVSQSNTSTQLEEKNIRQTNQTDIKDELNLMSYKKYDRTKSIMFKNSFSLSRSLTESKNDFHTINVFYFNSPVMKMIPYNKLSTVKELIQRALETFLLQNNDTIRASQPIERFQMRLPISENDFSPDMSIEPIHNDRVLSENMFQTLILVEKLKKETPFQSKPTKEYSFDDQSMSYSSQMVKSEFGCGQTVKIVLMDETYFELMRVTLDKDGTLEKLWRQIEENGFNADKEFVIKDDPDSEFELMPDHEVRLIEKNRLYLMTRKYLDEAEDEMPEPIRLKTLIHKQQSLNYLPPIGINEASKYEEFQVTKVNSFGIAIDRILGIDQTKIYNYHKQLHQQKRQATMMDKLLFGLNNQTGTKKPFRLIKDIIQIKKFHGGIEVIYSDKVTTYIIKSETDLERIYRKLSFLLDLNRISQKDSKSRTDSSTSLRSPKKGSAFFKF